MSKACLAAVCLGLCTQPAIGYGSQRIGGQGHEQGDGSHRVQAPYRELRRPELLPAQPNRTQSAQGLPRPWKAELLPAKPKEKMRTKPGILDRGHY